MSKRPYRPPSPPSTARELAFAVLIDTRPNIFAQEKLETLLRQTEVPDAERRLGTEITYGVLRRQGTLDVLIKHCVDRPRHQVEAKLWTLLRMGAYQLAFLDAIPEHAAVHETVELAKKRGESRWVPMLNAVLRKIAALVTDATLSLATQETFPLPQGGYRLCTEKLFPDPEESPIDYFVDAYSMPRWLAQRWGKRFDAEELFEIGQYINQSHPPSLRVNLLKTTSEEYLSKLEEASIKAKAGRIAESLHLKNPVRVETLPGYEEGLFSVQDETAMHAAHTLSPEPGMSVLDLCAAPGTKSSHLAELMHNEGEIIACDVNRDRLRRISQNVARLGHDCITVQRIERDGSDIPEGPFDAILVDAPCSNTGVLGKRPEARWRVSPDEIRELAELQQRLLSQALERAKPGGRVLYSTCSIEPEENEQVVSAVLTGRDDWRLESSRLFLPGDPSDGGFQALLVRS
ncbi:16S rRNA (cytosine(967)-C(5))-methyltransferase RsmB [Calycomorphotria hydatis]|uniref:Ribosomal RNA small subunit methyltransferase B n=1 Tax=Calycomorphotria hydatis TaxID=2528027 RepID=A0A517TF72_9PLAN|nr:16S rRNA (cytosine(967)-C(5))-methyltransferase RsmB [Calycomorphotria hydatis]QDT67008.1 Ribosomal RNA small subunit methyltransferase B [Calycomorphotria hydatis]